MNEKQGDKSYWATIPGILTGCAAIITAIGGLAGLITVLITFGVIKLPFATSTPTPTSTIAEATALT